MYPDRDLEVIEQSIGLEINMVMELRVQAEATCDPEIYEQAAAEFERLGNTASAAACRTRAKHYRAAS